MPVYICYQLCGWLSSFCGWLFIVCGCFCICGRDKSGPYSCEQIAITLLTDCDNAWRTFREIHTLNHVIHNEHSANYPHSTTKYTTDIPQIIHIQPRNTQRTFRKLSTFNHVIHNGHSVRRRGRFIVPVYFCYQFCGWL